MTDATESLHRRLSCGLNEALHACGALATSIGYPERHADVMRFEALAAASRLERAAAAIRRDVADHEARVNAMEGKG